MALSKIVASISEIEHSKVNLFVVSYFLSLVYFYFHMSNYVAEKILPYSLLEMIKYSSILISLICITIRIADYKRKLLFIVSLMLTILMLRSVASQYMCLLLPMVCAYNIKVDIIVKIFLFASIIMLSLIWGGVLLGIIHNNLTIRDDGVVMASGAKAYDTGFSYYLVGAYYMVSYMFLWLVKCRKNLTFFVLLLMMLFSLIVYKTYGSRMQVIMCAVLIFLFALVYKWKVVSFRRSFWKYYALFGYPLIMFFSYFFSTHFDYTDSEIYVLADLILSGRLRMNIEAFQEFEITLFGTVVDEYDSVYGYFYIDSGYISVLLKTGVVFSIMLMCLYSFLFYKAYKVNNKVLYIWLFSFSIFNIVNNFFLGVILPFYLLSLSDIDYLREFGAKRDILSKS